MCAGPTHSSLPHPRACRICVNAASDSNLDSSHTRTKRLDEQKKGQKKKTTDFFKKAEAKVSLLTKSVFKESKQAASPFPLSRHVTQETMVRVISPVFHPKLFKPLSFLLPDLAKLSFVVSLSLRSNGTCRDATPCNFAALSGLLPICISSH